MERPTATGPSRRRLIRRSRQRAAWHCTWRASLWRAPAVPWVH